MRGGNQQCSISLFLVLLGYSSQAAWAQIPADFTQIVGRHLTVITDLPSDPKTAAELQELPEIFEQAIPNWCQQFSVDPKAAQDWNVKLYLMLDRERFRRAGLIPKEFPEFKYGWQYKDDLWVVEQVNPYYRRHLMLHEGTHWFMFRKYGYYDTPWFAEGMSELLGTHRWVDKRLTMGIVPVDRLEVPYWGRISIIRDQSSSGVAPSLEEILGYSNSAHQNVDAYAWSWAIVWFLKQHPDTSKVFEALLRQKAMNTRETELWLKQRLSDRIPRIRAAWRSFVTELDYGYSPDPGLLQLSEKPVPLSGSNEFKIATDKGWQATGINIEQGSTLNLEASGQYSIAQQPKPWLCTPAGVTLEYYRGQPLGKLLMVVLAPQSQEQATELVETISVGSQLNWTAKEGGEIFFRINESAGMLSDNEGQLTVRITSKP